MDPPIQTEYFLSGGATILTFMLEGDKLVSSFCIRSAIPGYMVVPPDRTTFPYLMQCLRNISRSRSEIYSQVPTDIQVALEDGVVSGFVNTVSLKTEEGRLEESFWSTETETSRPVSYV